MTNQDQGIEQQAMLTTFGEYSASGFFTRTWFSDEDLRLGAPQSPTYEQNWHVWSTILHEWFHHLQVVGTVYGRFHYEITMMEGACIARALRQLFESRPLGTLQRPLLMDLLDADDVADDELLILGASAKLIRRALLGDEIEALPTSPEGIALPTSTLSPRVTLEGEEYAVGARHVMESHARSNEEMNLLATVGPECFSKAMETMDTLDPYKLVEELVRVKLGLDDFILSRVLCDIALNPEWPEEGETIAWEDFHPGWRIARMISELGQSSTLKGILPSEMDWERLPEYEDVYIALLDYFRWKQPEDILPTTAERFPWLTAEVIKTRREVPLAFALVMEHMDAMQGVSPVSFGAYTPADVEPRFFEDMDGATEFEATRNVAVIYEKTIPQMLTGRVITCPFHDTVFPSESGCVDRCHFAGFFHSIFGITVEQFIEIPVRFESDPTSNKQD